MITLDSRSRNILRSLLQAKVPVSSSDIAAELGLSARQVQYSLDDIEGWLEDRGASLIRKPGRGTIVAAPASMRRVLVEELEQFDNYLLRLSPAERVRVIVFSLLTSQSPLTAEELRDRVGVSRSTVLKDIDRVEAWLVEHSLTLIRRSNFGFKVEDDERNRRFALVDFLLKTIGEMPLFMLCRGSAARFREQLRQEMGLASSLRAYVEALKLEKVAGTLRLFEEALDLQYTDSARISLALQIAITIQAVSKGRTIDLPDDVRRALQEREVFAKIRGVISRLEEGFGVSLPKSEAAYIGMHALGARRRLPIGDEVDTWREDVGAEVVGIVESILTEASIHLHPYICVDPLLNRDLAYYLSTTLERLRFGLPVRNQLLSEVKEQYPYVFQIAERSSRVVEKRTGFQMPESEIACVTMHLGAAMERLRPYLWSQCRVLVVCDGGIATTSLLTSRLRTEFPELNVVDVTSGTDIVDRPTFSGDVDMIVSTVPLEMAGMPIAVVGCLLSGEDKTRIRQVLRTKARRALRANWAESENLPLSALLHSQVIDVHVEAEDWRDAVEKAGRLLVDDGAIEPGYVDAMTELIERNGPYVVIGPGVALLHARPEAGVRRLSMGLTTLRQPIPFGHPENDPVKVAAVLGAVDDRSHRRALSQLLTLVRDADAVDALHRAETKHEILRLVMTASQAP